MNYSNIKGVIVDWAGTSIDYGSFAPVAAFIDAFGQFGINVSANDVRKFMGYGKRDHTREILNLENISNDWIEKYNRKPTEDDVEKIFNSLSLSLENVILDYTEPIEGAVEFLEKMRTAGIKVGSTTGYVKEMMDLIIPIAEKKGFKPDVIVCPSDVPSGRPYPWMSYLNAIKMETYPLWEMVKFGDTVADINEGLNAGMWTVGITKSGNEVGLTLAETENLSHNELNELIKAAEMKLLEAGAHFVINGIWEAEKVLEQINENIGKGLKP
jgi:phosphonoacetaldehyde hydrolase